METRTTTTDFQHFSLWQVLLLLIIRIQTLLPRTSEDILCSPQMQSEQLCFYPYYALEFQARWGLEKYNLFWYLKELFFSNLLLQTETEYSSLFTGRNRNTCVWSLPSLPVLFPSRWAQCWCPNHLSLQRAGGTDCRHSWWTQPSSC